MPTGPESRLAAFPSAMFQQYVYTQKTAKFSGAPPLAPRLRRVGGTSQPETSAFPPSGNTGKSSLLCRLHDRKQTSRVYCNTGGISGIGGKADGIGGFETLLQPWLSHLLPQRARRASLLCLLLQLGVLESSFILSIKPFTCKLRMYLIVLT